MKPKHYFICLAAFTASLFQCEPAFAGHASVDSKEVAPAPDRWQFELSSPGWLAGLDGTVGVNGINADVDIGIDTILDNLDMTFAVRAEARKGRLGLHGEVGFASLSAGTQLTDRLVNNTRVQVDEWLIDLGGSWRLVDQPRYSIDLVLGTRYTNVYELMDITGNPAAVTTTSAQLTSDISPSLRSRLNNTISESAFINDLRGAINTRITDQLTTDLLDTYRKPSIPIAPLAGRHPRVVANAIEGVVREEEARIRAEVDALNLTGAAREAAVQARVAARQGAIAQDVAARLQRDLNRRFARVDDWFDPYIGLRARYQISKAFYTKFRGEVGGFGVGSDLMWQVEGSVGVNITRSIFTEVGYRALSFCYDNDGFLFDTITHGPQITTGVRF